MFAFEKFNNNTGDCPYEIIVFDVVAFHCPLECLWLRNRSHTLYAEGQRDSFEKETIAVCPCLAAQHIQLGLEDPTNLDIHNYWIPFFLYSCWTLMPLIGSGMCLFAIVRFDFHFAPIKRAKEIITIQWPNICSIPFNVLHNRLRFFFFFFFFTSLLSIALHIRIEKLMAWLKYVYDRPPRVIYHSISTYQSVHIPQRIVFCATILLFRCTCLYTALNFIEDDVL